MQTNTSQAGNGVAVSAFPPGAGAFGRAHAAALARGAHPLHRFGELRCLPRRRKAGRRRRRIRWSSRVRPCSPLADVPLTLWRLVAFSKCLARPSRTVSTVLSRKERAVNLKWVTGCRARVFVRLLDLHPALTHCSSVVSSTPSFPPTSRATNFFLVNLCTQT